MSNIILPTTKTPKERVNPKRLVIYSKPKVGKTTALSMLDNNLIFDLEPNGTDFVDALKYKIPDLKTLKEVGEAIKAANYPYTHISIDTTTALEDMVGDLAIKLYKETPMGKNFNGNNILKLPQGSGYQYLREAFFSVLNYIDTLAPNIILVGHLKDKALDETGTLVDPASIDLTGKIKRMVCAHSDAIGYLYRKDNKTILSFKTSEEIICGARPEHLKNKEITLLESDEEGKLISHWDQVYI